MLKTSISVFLAFFTAFTPLAVLAQIDSKLPECKGSPYNDNQSKNRIDKTWSDCVGTLIYKDGKKTQYIGISEYKNGERDGAHYAKWFVNLHEEWCKPYTAKGREHCKKAPKKIREQVGVYKNGKFHGRYERWDGTKGVEGDIKYTKIKSSKQLPLHTAFISLKASTRQGLQTRLKSLGFYKSSIDGLYGKGTATALKAYNKEYLGNADLTKKANVDALFADILKPLPSDDTQVATAQVEPVTETHEPAVAPAAEPDQALITLADMQSAYDGQDYSRAREAAEALAIQGEADAQFLLGKMYAEGLGTLQISKTAHMWFNIASLNGSAEAITERNAVARTMTASAVEEAQELALKCIQSKYADCGLSIALKQTPEAQQPVVAAIVDGAALGNEFKAQSVLRRKQLQYALKKLGVYSSSVDGLWGNGTRTAFSNYIKINDLKVSSSEDVFASVLSKVDVPTAFAAPKRQTVKKKPAQTNRNKDTAGLRAIIDNPPVTGAQAKAICEPQAKLAGRNADSGLSSSTRTRCTGYGYSINCRSSSGPSSAAEGIAMGIASALASSEARKAAMASCLAQYGWKK